VGLKLEDRAADYWQGRFSIGASQPRVPVSIDISDVAFSLAARW